MPHPSPSRLPLVGLAIAIALSTAFGGALPHAVVAAETASSEPEPLWTCDVRDEAADRKQRIETGMLPRVVFVGEDDPARVEERMAVHGVPAMSVAVIDDGELAWSAAWGETGVLGDPAGCSTLFQAGSLAKPVTALAALRMQAEGAIDLDRSVADHLRSYHLPQGRQTLEYPVTLRRLLTHTAGITPGGYVGYAQGEAIPSDLQTARGEAPSNARAAEVLERPGTSLVYSGPGYTVAEIALQDRFGQPFDELMRQWLLVPVGMRQADFAQPLPVAKRQRAARGHRSDGSVVAGGWHEHPEQAAAGLWATARDLAAFLIEVVSGHRGQSEVFSQESIRELSARPFEGHAFGFRLIGDGERTFLTHYGATVGYRAGMTIDLATGDGAVFLTNSDDGIALGREFLSAVSRVHGWPVFQETRVTRGTRTPGALRSLVGRYVFEEQGWTVSAVLDDDVLTLVFPNGDRYGMVPIQGETSGRREFIHPETAVRSAFEGEGADLRIHLYGAVGQRQGDEGQD